MNLWSLFTKSDSTPYQSNNRDFIKRVKALEKKRREYHRKEDFSNEARVLDELGVLSFQTDHFEAAQSFWKDALRIHQDKNNRVAMAEFYTKIANTYRRLSNLTEAARFYKKSLILDREFNQGDGVLLSLHNLGSAWLEMYKFDDALACFTEALDTSRENNLKEWESYTLARLGITFRQSHRYIDSFKFLDSGLKIAETLGILDLMVLNILGLAALYEDIGEYNQALNCYTDAILGSQKLKDTTFLSESLTCMAALKLHVGCLDEARQIVKTVQDLLPVNQPSLTRINLDLLQCEIYYSRGMKDNISSIIDRVLSLSESLSYMDGYIRAKIQLALMQIDRNSYHGAFSIVESTKGKTVKPCSLQAEIERLVISGRILVGLGNLDEACIKLEQAVSIAEKTRIPRYLWMTHYNLARVFDLQQRYQLAKDGYERAEKIVYQTALSLEPQMQKLFLEHKDREKLYQRYILLLLRLGHKEQAARILSRLDSPGLNRRLGHLFKE